MSHTVKLWERVLSVIVNILNEQCGFTKGRSTTDVIHIVRTLMEKYRDEKNNLRMAFIDLKKVFDIVPRELIF